MAQDPAMLLYYKDILVSCTDWDEDCLAWYIRLLCHQADKPDGLPNDVEKLAILASVKFSNYNRFIECWKHTLSTKFIANDSGLLVDQKQAKILEDRRKYTEKQALRGLVGSFLKKTKHLQLSEEQEKELSKKLFLEINIQNSSEENNLRFKHTLETLMGNANAIVNNKEEKGGVGEKEEKPPTGKIVSVFQITHPLDIDLLRQKVQLDKNFEMQIVSTGVAACQIDDWLAAYNRFLRFMGIETEVEKSYRFGFAGWLAKRNPQTENANNYQPTKFQNHAANQSVSTNSTGSKSEQQLAQIESVLDQYRAATP